MGLATWGGEPLTELEPHLPALRSRCEVRELRQQISPAEATREAQLTSEDPEGATAQRASGFNDSSSQGLPGLDRYPGLFDSRH